MYSLPTKEAFEVNKFAWELIYGTELGKEYEDEIIAFISKIFNITMKNVEDIMLKMERFNHLQDYKTGKLIENMSWDEFRRLIDRLNATE